MLINLLDNLFVALLCLLLIAIIFGVIIFAWYLLAEEGYLPPIPTQWWREDGSEEYVNFGKIETVAIYRPEGSPGVTVDIHNFDRGATATLRFDGTRLEIRPIK